MNQQEQIQAQKIPVSNEFAEVFTHFYAASNISNEPVSKTLVPAFQTLLVFSFGAGICFSANDRESVLIEKCLVLGPVKSSIDYTLAAGAEMLVANFKSDGFYRFFGRALIQQQFPVHPDSLIDEDCFSKLWEVLKKMNTTTERINHLLEFCKPYLKRKDSTISFLEEIDNELLNPVKAVAEKTSTSERAVQQKHKKFLGYSAKEINRFRRFLKAVKLLGTLALENKKIDWFEIIDQLGYYDQSQLIHDFKQYINLSPTQFLKFQRQICNPSTE